MGKPIKYGEFDPAASDGCTAIGAAFRLFTKEKVLPFKQCCVTHDKAYWYGGDVKLRKKADDQLFKCVKAHGHPLLGFIMWIFVRTLSGPKILGIKNPFPWSWEPVVTILPKEDEPK
jgi:hypothetical protein